MMNPEQLRIVYIAPGALNGNNGIHIYNVARAWFERGAHTTILAHGDIEQHAKDNGGRFGELISADRPTMFADVDNRVSIVHAWTPRQNVRLPTVALTAASGWAYVVHLEDNEFELLGRHLIVNGLPAEPPEAWFNVVPGLAYTHPKLMPEFLSGASGVSLITAKLGEHVPIGIPTALMHAGFDEAISWAAPGDANFRRSLGVRDDEKMVLYAGSVVPAHLADFTALSDSVAALRNAGRRIRLVQTGRAERLLPGVLHAGFLPRTDVARAMQCADVLVQPGGPDVFNDFRFPSKIPEFLASGRATILPASNIGAAMTDGENCLLLRDGSVAELARVIARVLDEPELAKRIGEGGREFAMKHLRWSVCAKALDPIYERAFEQTIRNRQ
jgi:glycosyltransferase involved in cell wall biosynthesis